MADSMNALDKLAPGSVRLSSPPLVKKPAGVGVRVLKASEISDKVTARETRLLFQLTSYCCRFFLSTDYLERNLDFSNLFCVLHHAQCYENKDLLRSYWDLIDKETEKALKSSEVITVDISVVEELVKRVRDIECQRSRVI